MDGILFLFTHFFSSSGFIESPEANHCAVKKSPFRISMDAGK